MTTPISYATRLATAVIAVLLVAGPTASATRSSASYSDHPACNDSGAITGSGGDDVLHGTDGDDVICGLGGADRIDGGRGDDVLVGGGGSDRITGEEGVDFCFGGEGDDAYASCEQCPTQAANTQIVFSRTNVQSRQGVYRMLPNGNHERRLSTMKPPYENHAYAPAWSPDGRLIAFEAGRENTYLYTMTASGKRLKQINDLDSSYTPNWSPDGSRIAYEIEDEGDETFNVYSMPSGGGEVTALTNSGEGRFHPHYAPDGSLIATDGNTEDYAKRAFIMAPDGKNETELLPGHVSYSPTWSPNSQLIAFAGATSDGQRYDTPTDIYVASRDASQATRLTSLDGIAEYPEWSPDGRKIVFIHRAKGTHDLYSVNPDGSGLRRLTDNRVREWEPAWSPDGTKIAFIRGDYDSYDLWLMDADGSHEHRITATKGNEVEPQWRPRLCS